VYITGAVVGQVSAVDLDSAPYDSFTYRLQEDEPDAGYFKVDGLTGDIRTATTFDRERSRMYRISVTAQSDTVSLSSQPQTVFISLFLTLV